MKIDLDLPACYSNRDIRIFAGIEEVAHFKQVGSRAGRWFIKKDRCNKCGKCCMDVPKSWLHGRQENGWCKHLEYSEGDRGYLCDYGVSRPFSCSHGDDAGKDYCSVTWEKI